MNDVEVVARKTAEKTAFASRESVKDIRVIESRYAAAEQFGCQSRR